MGYLFEQRRGRRRHLFPSTTPTKHPFSPPIMRYIHSEETLEIPEGGTSGLLFHLPVSNPKKAAATPSSYSTANLSLPAVKVHIKTRNVTVEGPRGKLTKNLGHLAVSFSCPEKSVLHIEMHHGARKNVATLRTVRTLINNMVIGVTKGFKYKMRYVYAHFPINVALEKSKETGLWEVEIRWVFFFLSYPFLMCLTFCFWVGWERGYGRYSARRHDPRMGTSVKKNQLSKWV